MADPRLEDLARRIDALPPADRFRLAAQFLDAKKARLAHAVADRATQDLAASLFTGERVPCPRDRAGRCADFEACAAAGRCTRG